MKTNLYDYFKCSSQEELLDKVVNKDASVKELTQLYDKEKELQAFENRYKITQPGAIVSYLSEKKMIPPEGTVTYLSLDTKNQVRKATNIPAGTFFEDIFKKVHDPKCPTVVPIVHDEALLNRTPNNNMLNMMTKAQQFKMAGYETLDTLVLQENLVDDSKNHKFFSTGQAEVSNGDFFAPEINLEKETCSPGHSIEENTKDLKKLPEYKEFTNHYANQMLLGKNIFDNDKDIKELLKLGNHSLGQEVVTLLKIDSEYNIEDIVQPFRGTVNSASIDKRMLAEQLMDSTNGMYFIHNHPSGQTEPSHADLKMTEQLYELSNLLNKPLYDSLIIGHNVYEMTKDRENHYKFPFIKEMNAQKTSLEWDREEKQMVAEEKTSSLDQNQILGSEEQLTLFEGSSEYTNTYPHEKSGEQVVNKKLDQLIKSSKGKGMDKENEKSKINRDEERNREIR